MTELHKRAWLITPQAPDTITLNYSSIQSTDLVVAVDGGFDRCLSLGIRPRMLIGDFDSLNPALLQKLPQDCQMITHPAAKDETDTQLALEYCLKQGVREVIICNHLQGRFDHSMALVQNLLQAKRNGIKACVVSDNQIATILDETNETTYPAGTTLSLISLSEKAEFKSSQGLSYPLDNLSLFNWQSKGISNIIIEPLQTINLASGIVLTIITQA